MLLGCPGLWAVAHDTGTACCEGFDCLVNMQLRANSASTSDLTLPQCRWPSGQRRNSREVDEASPRHMSMPFVTCALAKVLVVAMILSVGDDISKLPSSKNRLVASNSLVGTFSPRLIRGTSPSQVLLVRKSLLVS